MPYILSAFADEAAESLAQQIYICEENGVKWIEIRAVDGKNISELTVKEAKSVKKLLDERGFFVSSIGSPFGKIGINEDFKPHLEKFKNTVEVSHVLGAKYIRIFSFRMPLDVKDGSDSYYNKVVERMGLFLENADGIQLCHENEKGIYADTAERCKKLCDATNGKLRLVFDPANFIQCGVGIESAYSLLHDDIEYFHIKDCLHESGKVVPAGYGDGKIEWLVNAFADKRKMAFLSVEPHLKVLDGHAEPVRTNCIDYEYETAQQAFSTAVMALKTVLCANGYMQTKDFEKGYGEWIK